jgi:hypothetical protein
MVVPPLHMGGLLSSADILPCGQKRVTLVRPMCNGGTTIKVLHIKLPIHHSQQEQFNKGSLAFGSIAVGSVGGV